MYECDFKYQIIKKFVENDVIRKLSLFELIMPL